MPGQERLKRLSDNLSRLAAEIIFTELKEPLPAVVTVTGASITKDLQNAKVYYTVLGSDEDRAAAAKRLRQVSSFVQREVGRRLHLRSTPALTFVYDDTREKSSHVLKLLAELKANDGDSHTDS